MTLNGTGGGDVSLFITDRSDRQKDQIDNHGERHGDSQRQRKDRQMEDT